ncbi:hypothetical protein [Desulfoferrobacter suflitae]|uniref:hypothetical protein n=1 Tax=Desulfoferrobacter suflitae TaxID=2865782 RepID=UPI00216415F8|nr:hypothetical protein [Desulfoferrobacter suflitae]MCK8603451.1 hypothetical protein [Desulfoferrobacter suflitae]
MNSELIYQIFAGSSAIVFIFAAGFYLGHRRSSRKYHAQSAHDRAEMLSIERALKQFWDHEKQKLEEEKLELQRRIDFLEGRLAQYRRKAAGIGMMGLRKSKLSDMFISLLIENETLEEKLFLQNLKLKQERDEFLENELRHISYKRILLSELISQGEVRREMERVINDKGHWKRLEIKQRELKPVSSESLVEEGESA